MLKTQYLERSPIRIMEKSIHGGLGKGNLGVFASRKGVGKTGCLIHVAIDTMLGGKKILHVSFNSDTQHISKWYNIIYSEFTKAYKLENSDFFDEIIRNHLIMNLTQSKITIPEVVQSLNRMIAHANFSPSVVIVDGLDFEKAELEDLRHFRAFAEHQSIEMWFSATLHRERMDFDDRGIPAPVNRFYDLFSVIIMLVPQTDHVDLKLLKDREATDLEKLRLKLDPKTFLISNRRI